MESVGLSGSDIRETAGFREPTLFEDEIEAPDKYQSIKSMRNADDI